ncbi:MAG: hypothetical protein U9R49_13085 [Bacteroidota bacterium]|nr:hypothetical protein [Bacteroidota bacterium]
MKRLMITLGWISISWTIASAQITYLDRPDLLEKVETCIQHTYGFSFGEARDIQAELSKASPGHPAPVFLEALIVYWENFPLLPSNKASEQFVSLMDGVIEMAKELREDSLTYTEGVFFDLFGRAFKAMFWADNGKSGKVIGDLGNMYRYTKKGFDLKEEFVEFYFSTGLYNYYIEAYPEAHPAYKPFVSFMHKGDRELGLEQLGHAIDHAVFLKVEAILFMSIIQLKYQDDLNTAAIYAEKLVRQFPGNIMYQGHLIIILLYQQRYSQVKDLLLETADQKDRYSEMTRTLAGAFLAEKVSGDETSARTGYLECIEYAESFGPFAEVYEAIAYMGLSRLHEKQRLQKEADAYARKASRLTNYAFILDEQAGSR